MHLALQFLGRRNGAVRDFKTTQGSETNFEGHGRDTFEGLKRQIDAFELRSLLCE